MLFICGINIQADVGRGSSTSHNYLTIIILGSQLFRQTNPYNKRHRSSTETEPLGYFCQLRGKTNRGIGPRYMIYIYGMPKGVLTIEFLYINGDRSFSELKVSVHAALKLLQVITEPSKVESLFQWLVKSRTPNFGFKSEW